MATSFPSCIGNAFCAHKQASCILLAALVPFLLPLLIVAIPLLLLFLAPLLPLFLFLLFLYKSQAIKRLRNWVFFCSEDTGWKHVGSTDSSFLDADEEKRRLEKHSEILRERDGGGMQSFTRSDMARPEDWYSAEDMYSAASSEGGFLQWESCGAEEFENTNGSVGRDSEEGWLMPEYEGEAREGEGEGLLGPPSVGMARLTDVKDMAMSDTPPADHGAEIAGALAAENAFGSTLHDGVLESWPSAKGEQPQISQDQLGASESGVHESIAEPIRVKDDDAAIGSGPSNHCDAQEHKEEHGRELECLLPHETYFGHESLDSELDKPKPQDLPPSSSLEKDGIESTRPEVFGPEQKEFMDEDVARGSRPSHHYDAEEHKGEPGREVECLLPHETYFGHEPLDSELDKRKPQDLPPSSSLEKDGIEIPRPEVFGAEQKEVMDEDVARGSRPLHYRDAEEHKGEHGREVECLLPHETYSGHELDKPKPQDLPPSSSLEKDGIQSPRPETFETEQKEVVERCQHGMAPADFDSRPQSEPEVSEMGQEDMQQCEHGMASLDVEAWPQPEPEISGMGQKEDMEQRHQAIAVTESEACPAADPEISGMEAGDPEQYQHGLRAADFEISPQPGPAEFVESSHSSSSTASPTRSPSIDVESQEQEKIRREREILTEISAIKKIVGCQGETHASAMEQIMELYLFLGMEPCELIEDDDELAGARGHVDLLKVVVGVK